MKVKAFMFDVEGTVFDWHSCLLDELTSFGIKKEITDVKWRKFIKSWKKRSSAMTLNSKRADLPLGTIEGVNRLVLEDVLEEFEIHGLAEYDKTELCNFWYKMKPWEDSVKGIEMLKSKYFVSTLTILSIPIISTSSKNAGLNWDLILSCQMLEHYKLLPEAYLKAAEWINLKPEEIMMVASHSFDLAGAQAAGFKTGHISRPNEWGNDKGTIDTDNPHGDPSMTFDVYADNIIDFAKKMGCTE